MPRTPREFRRRIFEMMSDEEYLSKLHIRLREGTLNASIEKLFWEVVGANPVTRLELDDKRKRPITGEETDPIKRARILLEAAKSVDDDSEDTVH